MAEQKIEFRKIRDFGENLNDTFFFIGQNFKPLLKSFFAICAIFLFSQAIISGLYQSRTFSVFDQLKKGSLGLKWISSVFSIDYFLVLFTGWMAYISIKTTLGAYIKYYVDNNGLRPGIEDIWSIFKKYFFKIFFYSLPVFLLIVAGYLFCIIPGIYLAVVLVPFEIILIMEDASFSQAWNRCFSIIKENFWISLATYVVAGLIYYFCSGIISSVVGIITGIGAFLTTDNISTTAAIVTSVLSIISSTFYLIFFVSVTFHYFTLVEIKDGTGILSRINNIGKEKNNFDNIEEHF